MREGEKSGSAVRCNIPNQVVIEVAHGRRKVDCQPWPADGIRRPRFDSEVKIETVLEDHHVLPVIIAASWLIYTVIREYHQQVTQGFLIGVDKFKPPQGLMMHGFRVRRRSKVLIPGLGRCTAVKADNQGK